MAKREQQENSVYVTGQLLSLTPVREQAAEGIVEVVEFYGNSRQKSTSMLVHFPDRKLIEEVFNAAEKRNKSLYISFAGYLANRKFSEEDKYADHVYVVASKVGPANINTQRTYASVYFQGEVVSSSQKFTKNGKPFASLLVKRTAYYFDKNSRTMKEVSSSVNVSAFTEELVEKVRSFEGAATRAKVLVIGTLSSYERNGVPQLTISANNILVESATIQSIKEDSGSTVIGEESAPQEAAEKSEDSSIDDIFDGLI